MAKMGRKISTRFYTLSNIAITVNNVTAQERLVLTTDLEST